jgi:hydroxyacylglutathione hydrolase
MKHENKEGPALLGKLPAPRKIDAEALKKLVREKAIIVDTRSWSHFREGHVEGALWAPLNNYFPNAAGSYIEPGQQVYLIIEEGKLQDAVTALIRIGIDEVTGYATPEIFEQYRAQGGKVDRTASLPITQSPGQHDPKHTLLLDVRGKAEFEEGHVRGAKNLPYTYLTKRLAEVPRDRKILVYCRTDNRSAIASALLQSQGYDVIQLSGGIVGWQQAQGEMVR